MQNILELKNLKKHYPILGGVFRREVARVKALDGVDLEIRRVAPDRAVHTITVIPDRGLHPIGSQVRALHV